MKKITVRPAVPSDAERYADWLKKSENINLVDRDVYRYPGLATVVVEADGEPVVMNSFHPVMMMEALAPSPEDVKDVDRARSLLELFATVERLAKESGVKEVWFGCADERVQRFVERRGAERIAFPMYRVKVDRQ